MIDYFIAGVVGLIIGGLSYYFITHTHDEQE
jgi:hypothetical protein